MVISIFQKIDNEKEPESYEFLKEFYYNNRIRILQYENLRKNFHKMIDDVLGKDYYNTGMDVYECDRICCEDIAYKAKSFIQKFKHHWNKK